MELVLQMDWLHVYDNVLSENYCNEIITKTTDHLSHTRLNPIGNYDIQIEKGRTSNQYFIPSDDGMDKKIDECASKLTKINSNKFENTSIIRYQKGQEYKQHHDYFSDEGHGIDKIRQRELKISGNRVATALFFLNDGFEGGETIFPLVNNLTIKPKTGRCIVWMNQFKHNSLGKEIKQVNGISLHAGLPIIKGEKFIATKWIREKKYKKI